MIENLTNLTKKTNKYLSSPALVLTLPALPQLIILGIIFLTSITLNCLSIICIIGARAITPINLLIINLAISDLIYALTIPIFAVHIVIPWWPFGRIGCQLAIGIDIIAMIVGVYTITALSIERYFDVRETTRRLNNKIKLIFVSIYIIVLWLFSILFPIPISSSLFVHNRNKRFNENIQLNIEVISECRSNWTKNQLSNYIQMKFIFAYLFPSIITCLFSLRLILFLHRWSKQSRHFSFSNRSLNIYKKRATTLVLFIISSFFVLWSPLWILQFYDTFNRHGPTEYIQIWNFLTLVFVYTNGLLNPLIYLILTKNFQDYMKKHRWKILWKSSRQKSQFKENI